MKWMIYNARLVLVDRVAEKGYLVFESGRILNVGLMKDAPASGIDRSIDAAGRYLSPGFIDLHIHGGGGADFRDGDLEAFVTVMATHRRGGTTTMMPTLSSGTRQVIEQALRAYGQAADMPGSDGIYPRLCGAHIEGPYFSVEQRGAQPAAFLRSPQPEEYLPLTASFPFIKRWSVACELPGALAMASDLAQRGIVMSIGHSNADYDQTAEAYANGFSCVTHLYSGCSIVHRVGPWRHGGVVEAGLLLDGMDVEVIADGKHLPRELLQLIYKCKGPDRIALITDSIRAGGVSVQPGMRFYDDKEKTREILVEDGVGIMPDRLCFAGSVATTAQLVRTMHRTAGVGLPEAVRMACLSPARMAGLEYETGSLTAGKRADLVLFDDYLEISMVSVNGQVQEY